MDFLLIRSFVAQRCRRAQATVEYGLVVAGAALLALLSYTLFNPIVTAAADQVKALIPSFH